MNALGSGVEEYRPHLNGCWTDLHHCPATHYLLCICCLCRSCRRALSEEVKQSNMPVDVCTAALQGVQGVLPFVSPSRRAALLAAVCTLSTRSAARSAVKAACLAFQQSLLDRGGQVLYSDSNTGAPLLPETVLIEWLQVSAMAMHMSSSITFQSTWPWLLFLTLCWWLCMPGRMWCRRPSVRQSLHVLLLTVT